MTLVTLLDKPSQGTKDLDLSVIRGEDDGSTASEDTPSTREKDPSQLRAENQRREFERFLSAQASTQEVLALPPEEVPMVEAAAESTRIIERARDYQQELFERAKDENVIAVLDTGSGKTLIACLLMRHVLHQELIDRDIGKPPRIIFFMANSVHLVKQQARVIKTNLVTSPWVFTGSDGDEWKVRTSWPRIIQENAPIVCTPAILQQILDANLVCIEQISLLIFDEAHHAKKDHPYSRIIRSFYLKCAFKTRPKIFGMTASPVDAKGSIDTKAADLEQLLHSKIVTTPDLSILPFAPKPVNVIWHYDKPVHRLETELCHLLLSKCSFSSDTKKGFDFAKTAVRELGPWCADRVWTHVFGLIEHESSGLLRKYEQSKAYTQLDSVEARESALTNLQEAASLVSRRESRNPTPESIHLSPKLLKLYDELFARYSKEPRTRTIVFVDQRFTALVLKDCFTLLRIPHLRPGVLLGISSESTSLRRQEEILDHFRAGLTNLVFATSVADEGIDVPQCNLCIRFDIYKSPIQYMQSRGRARMHGSTYAHMVQSDDQNDLANVQYAIECDQYIRAFCRSLPNDRLLGRGTQLERLIARDSANKSFKTKIGATCDFGNSLLILNRYTSSLHHLGALETETYEEEIDDENKQFRYKVRLPPSTEPEVVGAVGEWKQNKQLAKRSAAFNCCWLLRRKGRLDDNLLSIHQKIKPENLNARLAVSGKLSSYPQLMKPSVWSEELGSIPTHLYACVLCFYPTKTLSRRLSPLVILSRKPIPRIPIFSIFVEENIATEVRLSNIEAPFNVDEECLAELTRFTLDGIFSDIFNKHYQHDTTMMSYWLVPAFDHPCAGIKRLGSLIDMQAVKVIEHGRYKWCAGESIGSLWTNKFICDPRNGKYHYFSHEVVPGASIFDPVPQSASSIRQKGRQNIIDFSDSTWRASKKTRATTQYDPNQPVLSAEIEVSRRNFLEPLSQGEGGGIICMIAPQPLEVSQLSPKVASAALLWPSIIHYIESCMIALEAFESLGLIEVPVELALEALTKGRDVDEMGTQLGLDLQHTFGKNYERLEFIGDSLLKMMTTITVFNRTNCDEEGMHCRRMEILCNRRLFDVSTHKHHLYRFIRTRPFNRTTWYPEHLVLLKGRGAQKDPKPVKHAEVKHDLSMKTIADVSEAIIGAAVATSRSSERPFDLGIKAITLLVNSADHTLECWEDIKSMYEVPEWSTQKNDVQANRLAKEIEARMGYSFNYPRLLRSAFTHSSDTNATVPDLQRLEFLGDAVLDWVCISWLFHNNPTRDPQWLTEHKMAMVSNKFLAALAVVLGFDKFVNCTTTRLYHDIVHYARKVREIYSSSSSTSGSDGPPSVSRNFWTQIESPPKALSDLVESYLGAVLVDSNWNYKEIENFFQKHILWFFEDIEQYDGFANRHPTSYLYKKFHDEFKCHDFGLLNSEPREGLIEVVITAGVVVHGQTIASSQGGSAKYAKVRASQKALAVVESMTVDEFRRKFGCNCKTKEQT